MKRRVKKSKTTNSLTEEILESISDGVFTVDEQWRITSFNRAAEEITGVSRAEAIGMLCSEVFRSSMCEKECALRETMATGKPRIGISGYIINAEGHRIPISVSTALLRDSHGEIVGGAETFRDLSEIETLRYELEGRFHSGNLVSRSPLMQRIFEVLPVIATSPSTVLLQGETGTGKELMARTIHSLSLRKDGPFVALNCGALPDTLLESELFGYKKGAFTGAATDKPGRFSLARGGTLFLDEIGDMSPALQVRLLRVVQEHTFEPLGATKTEKSDSRIIVATNRDLLEMVHTGAFREDLFYRINIVRISLPPLRERKEDIPLLVDFFINRFNQLHHKNVSGIKPDALSLLMGHDWPGNIRELENAVERSFVLCDDSALTIAHLPDELWAATHEYSTRIAPIKQSRELSEAQTILAALERNDWNRLKTAKELCIHKSTLFRKIAKLGLKPQANPHRTRTSSPGPQ